VILKFLKKPKKQNCTFNDLVFVKHVFFEEDKLQKKLFYLSFGEFGCEALLPLFVIPRLNNNFPEYRKIVVGWHDREYFYRESCDEYWELNPNYMSLKNNSHAFQNISTEIQSLSKRLKLIGSVIDGSKMGKICVSAKCLKCFFEFEVDRGDKGCPKCFSEKIESSLLQGCKVYKNFCSNLPSINKKSIDFVNKHIPENTVALFARNRKTYDRNFPVDYYDQIINLLSSFGYNIVLLGEKISSHNLNNKNIINLIDQNLETTFAVVNKCVFSLQYFTASTRISSILNKPFILFESLDQIYGRGQEGIRLSLATKNYNNKKIVIANYKDVLENQNESIDLLRKAIIEFVFEKNSSDLFMRPNDYALSLQESGIKTLW
jgi:predicted Zn-ribbon and HTH transcriptional regulator